MILINRNEEFSRCKEGNLTLILAAIKDGKVECRYQSAAISVEAIATDDCPARFNAKTPEGTEIIGCHRVIARLGATPPRKLVESFGVKFPNADPTSVPQLTDTYESNVPGLHIIGALGGYPLIKQAMNQGYEVVEYIRGNRVDPADEPLLKSKFANYKRSRTVSHGLILLQRQIPLLAGLTTLQLREFMLDSEIRTPEPGEIIFNRNDYTDTFYSILEGEVGIEINGGTPEARWTVLRTGDFFGELSLVSGRRRAATAKAALNCVLVETPRRSMLKLIASVDSVRRTIDRAFLKRAVRANLTQDLPDADLDALIQGAQLKSYAAGETVFAEGAVADGLYLIRRGSVTVSRRIGGRDVVLSYVAAGNYVGEFALLSDAPRMGTVRTSVATETIVLDGARFKVIVAKHPKLRATLEERFLDRIRANVQMESQGESGNIISYLLAAGDRRGDRRPADRRKPVHPLRQLRKGLRRHARGDVAAEPRGGPDVRSTPRADVVPPLRASALHEGLPARRDPPRGERRSLHHGHVHRLRQLRAQLSVQRDPDGAEGPGSRSAGPVVVASARRGRGARSRGQVLRQVEAEGRGQVRHVQGAQGWRGLRARLPDGRCAARVAGKIPRLRGRRPRLTASAACYDGTPLLHPKASRCLTRKSAPPRSSITGNIRPARSRSRRPSTSRTSATWGSPIRPAWPPRATRSSATPPRRATSPRAAT